MKYKLIAAVTATVISIGFILNSCSKESLAANNSTGKGGSLSRFTIAGDYLYAVDNNFLYAYSLQNPVTPEKVFTSQVQANIETIYPFNNFLFLGTATGLFIYSIDTASAPRLIGLASHARSCDPVVANDSVAFVTLKGGSNCGPATSGLYIHDIKNISQPVLKKTITLPDPIGLGIQDSILYVCCGNGGLKVFNVNSPFSPTLIATKNDGEFVDVIPYNGTLICFMRSGITLYDIAKPASPVLIKTIAN